MTFWDQAFKVAQVVGKTALNVGIAVANSADERANKIREFQQEYSSMDDEELLKIVHSDGFLASSGDKKGVAYRELKKRGYSVEAINEAKS